MAFNQNFPGQPVGIPKPDSYPIDIEDYKMRGTCLFSALVPENPDYKHLVGDFINEFVEKIAGSERTPRIIDVLINLPLDEIKAYLSDYNKFEQKIGEAVTLLDQELQNQAQ